MFFCDGAKYNCLAVNCSKWPRDPIFALLQLHWSTYQSKHPNSYIYSISGIMIGWQNTVYTLITWCNMLRETVQCSRCTQSPHTTTSDYLPFLSTPNLFPSQRNIGVLTSRYRQSLYWKWTFHFAIPLLRTYIVFKNNVYLNNFSFIRTVLINTVWLLFD